MPPLQARRLHPVFKALCSLPDIDPKYLTARVKAVDPDFMRSPIPTKVAFKPPAKRKRMEFCHEHCGHLPSYWYQWVLAGESTLYE